MGFTEEHGSRGEGVLGEGGSQVLGAPRGRQGSWGEATQTLSEGVGHQWPWGPNRLGL